jgi:Ca-activated chloride channel family protein
VAIRLKGEVNGKPQEYVFEGTFPPVNADNEFVPRLWATRRVGHLLDEIRLRGEDAELKQEVVRLGKEYGIMTPYTSYLVLEDDQAYRQRNPDRTPGPPPPSRPEPIPLPMPMLMNGTGAARTMGMGGALKEAKAPAAAAVPVDSDRAADMVRAATRAKAEKGGERQYTVVTPDSRRADEYLRAQEGRDAVQLSEAIQDYKRKDVAGEQLAGVRRVEGRVFYLIGGVWVDSRYKETMKRVTVKFAGDDYFKFVADNPEIRKCLALGEKVIVCLDENTAVVVE